MSKYQIGISIVMVVIVFIIGLISFRLGRDSLSGRIDELELKAEEVVSQNLELEKTISDLSLAYGLAEEGEPTLTIQDFSGCNNDLHVEREAVVSFLKEGGFQGELRIIILPSSYSLGNNLALGSFQPTPYGAKIVLDGSAIRSRGFDETLDHEFGHLDHWLQLGELAWRDLTHEEHEGYAYEFADSNDLYFLEYRVRSLSATEEGQGIGPIFYRLDGTGPHVYLLDPTNPKDGAVVIDGKVRYTILFGTDGWHQLAVSDSDRFVTYNNTCAHLGIYIDIDFGG